MTEPVLRVRDFTVEFWVDGVWYPAAINMNFDVKAGEVLAIVGESGSGKSTTAMGIMSLLASNARTSGSVQVNGQEMLDAPASVLRRARGKEVAYIFQEPMTALNPVYTIGFQIVETLRTHFDMGPKEARAWTITKGTRAPQAAGVIHTDFEKGFIRAETIAYDDYITHKGEAGARDAGRLRLEGKDYPVADGDVMHFRFNT